MFTRGTFWGCVRCYGKILGEQCPLSEPSPPPPMSRRHRAHLNYESEAGMTSTPHTKNGFQIRDPVEEARLEAWTLAEQRKGEGGRGHLPRAPAPAPPAPFGAASPGACDEAAPAPGGAALQTLQPGRRPCSHRRPAGTAALGTHTHAAQVSTFGCSCQSSRLGNHIKKKENHHLLYINNAEDHPQSSRARIKVRFFSSGNWQSEKETLLSSQSQGCPPPACGPGCPDLRQVTAKAAGARPESPGGWREPSRTWNSPSRPGPALCLRVGVYLRGF